MGCELLQSLDFTANIVFGTCNPIGNSNINHIENLENPMLCASLGICFALELVSESPSPSGHLQGERGISESRKAPIGDSVENPIGNYISEPYPTSHQEIFRSLSATLVRNPTRNVRISGSLSRTESGTGTLSEARLGTLPGTLYIAYQEPCL